MIQSHRCSPNTRQSAFRIPDKFPDAIAVESARLFKSLKQLGQNSLQLAASAIPDLAFDDGGTVDTGRWNELVGSTNKFAGFIYRSTSQTSRHAEV